MAYRKRLLTLARHEITEARKYRKMGMRKAAKRELANARDLRKKARRC